MTALQTAPLNCGSEITASIKGASDRLALAARSASTIRAYRSDWTAFAAWADTQSVASIPARPETVAAWIAHQMDAGKKASSISRSIAAITCAHEVAGFDGFGGSQKVKDALKGMRRTIGTAQTKKEAATADRVTLMIAAQPDTLIGKRNRALLALGFAGAFRRSELVALHVEDLRDVDGGAIATIRKSKTDQDGAGQEIGILNGSRLRPLDAVKDWCEAAQITEGPIFRSVNRHGKAGAFMTDRAVADVVKAAAQAAGFDPATFSGHSLRAGFITSGAEAGVDALRIAETSRHKNLDVLKGYVRRASLMKNHAGISFI